MPSLQNVTVNDRETTPVSHVFVPRDVKDGVGLVVRSTGVPVADEQLTVVSRKSGTKFKSRVTLSVPVAVATTVNGVTTYSIARYARAMVEFTFDETSTTQERTNLVGMLQNSLGTGVNLVHKAVVDLEGIYGS